MSIPPNQFLQEHPRTRFVLLDSSAGPVPSQAKGTHQLGIRLYNFRSSLMIFKQQILQKKKVSANALAVKTIRNAFTTSCT